MSTAREGIIVAISSDHLDYEQVTELLDQVEDDRAHTEAEKLRNEAAIYDEEGERNVAAGLYRAADMVDPYEMRDGQLVRKSDGKAVVL
jgi:hypothetical protein